MKENITGIQSSNLLRLKKILNYSISGILLIALTTFLPYSISFGLAAVAALIFTPFMLYILYLENKKGWIIFFIFLVALPTLFFFIGSSFLSNISWLNLVSLALFYFYCFILRFEVNDWVRERMARRQFENEKRELEIEHNNFMKSYE